MPYRTKFGSHYHEEYGCHGATIPCDSNGLTPCSDCCGRAKGGTGTPSTTTGAGTPTGAGAGAGIPVGGASTSDGREPISPEVVGDADAIKAACDEGDTVILADGTNLVFREAHETGFPQDGYVLEEPVRGMPIRLATDDDLQRIGRQLRNGEATLGSGEAWGRFSAGIRERTSLQAEMGNRLRAAFGGIEDGFRIGQLRQGPASIDGISPGLLASLEGMTVGMGASVAPAPPVSRGIGSGCHIEVDGTIARSGDVPRPLREAQDAASSVVRRFESAAPARWPSPDYAMRARGTLLARIDNEMTDLPAGVDREAFRKTAQQVWNTMHPEAPVLEWSRADEGYVSDSPESVVMRRRNYDEMRDFNGGSNAIGYDYLVMDKVTGQDVTEELRQRDLDVRRIDRGIADIEQDMMTRANREIAQQRTELYDEWLSRKGEQSDAWRYHAGSHNWDTRSQLLREFVQDTGYTAPSPSPRPTDEERDMLSMLNERRVHAVRARDASMLNHGVDDDVMDLIR